MPAGDRRQELGAVAGVDDREHARGDLRHGGRGIAAQSGTGVAPPRAATAGSAATALVART
jgi:hypothetical protein